jgi:alpha-L-arabinofuranosidase
VRHPISLPSVLVGLLLALVATPLPAQTNAPLAATITIRGAEAGNPVSPELYGVFFEDINYAADGGLYAELVENRSFEYFRLPGTASSDKDVSAVNQPLGRWQTVARGGRTCSMKIEMVQPIHPRNPTYCVLKLAGSSGEAGIANLGYDTGIPVQAGAVYDFSLHLRQDAGDIGPVRVALESSNGTVLASTELAAPGRDWRKDAAVLTATQTDPAARLVLTTASTGTLYVDMISLFPRDTFKGRRNGLRRDLAQAVADIRPRVVRFPGGCIVHGNGLDNAYHWKETVGPVEQRRPKWNRWGYHQSFGLGYFEYFQFCEDIGAEPLPIVPAGVSCGGTGVRPYEVATGRQLTNLIEDVIDLVEFANGPADSPWGRVRAEMGHPAPFGLKYIGLGNEEHDTRSFREVFPHFVKALREKHPEIQIVGNSGLGSGIPLFDLMEANGVEISDEHYYQNPEWYIDNRARFDTVKRGKTKVFVGEYASRGNAQFNAVAEAVYLTGIERNADHVVMTAYAPLFARYDFTQWKAANLIWFDNREVVKTPNFWVQQLFATHLGDRYLSNTVVFPQGATAAGRPPVLGVSPTLVSSNGTLHIKIANPMASPVKATFQLEGFKRIDAKARRIELAAPADARNERGQPPRVAPRETPLAAAPTFTFEVPPTSVQVLVLQTSRR